VCVCFVSRFCNFFALYVKWQCNKTSTQDCRLRFSSWSCPRCFSKAKKTTGVMPTRPLLLFQRRFFLLLHALVVFFLIISQMCNATEEEEKQKKRIPTPVKDVKRPVDTSRLAPFDKDIREDCQSLLEYCQSDVFAHVYLQCPASCSKFLEEEGMVGTAHENPEALYDVGTLRTYRGNRIETDRFEGYVLVLAVIPLLPGMAVYYYEMMEHLHSVFTPHVEFVVMPMDHGHGIHIQLQEKGKVVVLEEESVVTAVEKHPWIQHLTSVKPRKGLGTTEFGNGDIILQRPLATDRVTIYIVSADGYFVERLVSPSLDLLQKKVRLYTKTIDYEL